MENYTKGEWSVIEGGVKGSLHVIRTVPNGGVDRVCEIVIPSTGCRVNAKANAHLIVSAVNACIKVNPDNPQAVAERITDLCEALKELTDFDEQGGNGKDHYILIRTAKEALLKVEEK